MSFFLKIIVIAMSCLLMAACSQEKDVTYFKKHPNEILYQAADCFDLNGKNEILKNKSCLAIADIEKPACEAELKNKGMLFLPNGGLASCDDKLYLISRPIVAAKMKAYLEGTPDPLVEYMNKKHPKKSD